MNDVLQIGGKFGSIPESACMFAGGEVELKENKPGSKSAKLRIKARGGQPIEHWYWGRVVHDLAGMRHKSRIAVDYAHNDDEVLGYVNHFDSETGDLWLSGALTPWREDDRASEVMYKMGEGVPYEASIFFGGDGIKIQEVAEGEVAPVNGFDFEGPGIIVRAWPLRGVAVCPYGADENTESKMQFGSGKTFAAEVVKTNQQEEVKMSEKPEAVEVEAAAEAQAVEAVAVEAEAVETKELEADAPVVAESAPEPEVVAPVQEEEKPDEMSRKEFCRIVDEFGAEIAAQTVKDAGSYETALKLAYSRANEKVKALETQCSEMKAARAGQPVPVADATKREKPSLFKTGK